ncbi:MAG TPA: carbon monoxide dehydrogenase [Gammaproteobacteria bacterium]|nr:carbon monoxide dehydrogenase [Gammaproteobacteria bacterium]
MDSLNNKAWIGKSLRRVEDPKFLLGRGRYIDDIELPRMLHAAVVRSPHAHARILGFDIETAKLMPGVKHVLTGIDALNICQPLPDLGPHPDQHVWRCLAADKARYVGEAVAVVVATTRALAEDACAKIIVHYECLPAITDPEVAIADRSNLVHEALQTNVAFAKTLTWGDIEQTFQRAELVIKDRLRWHRSGAQPLETVGAIADYDPTSGTLTLYQNSLTFSNYLFLLANTLHIPSNKLRVIPTPAGGSFGSKTWAVKVAAIAGALSKLCRRPVKFVEDRIDNLSNCDHHGSDRIYNTELAINRDGAILGLRMRVVDDYGAYLQYGVGTHANALAQIVGPYKIESVEYQIDAVLTNKCQQGACRGFGSEVHNWALERMVDKAADALQLNRIEIRRRNFIKADEFPYGIPFGNEYDSGDYHAVLNKALATLDHEGWLAKQQQARQAGRCVGIGYCTANERSVFAGTELGLLLDSPVRVSSMPESISVAVDAIGNITATLYSGAFTGNSAETMVAQLIAEELQLEPTSIAIQYAGSTAGMPGTGPAGSRFTVMIAGAIQGACAKIRDKACQIGAQLLKIPETDVEWRTGGVSVSSQPNTFKSLVEIAAAASMFKHDLSAQISSGLEGHQVYDHPHMTMPKGDDKDFGIFFPFVGHGCHIAVVEVDPKLGIVEFLDYVAVHDNGTIVNPRSMEGQILGGTAHGIGTALMEEYVYGTDGDLKTNSYHHYLMPTSMDIPAMKIAHLETPSPFTPHGIKGGGEAGRLMAPAAISSAIEDALVHHKVRVDTMPATPTRISAWIMNEESAEDVDL